uniref:Uncharacterized protein n=1 Tax=Candidatus Kentrum sp. LFY TaxID=2126342 RepID=A0A450WI80_9GAMM|nr:MAG: hypothetical protein BECKLFY1418C_GA0070996_102546 [Candidatus Kentron sp. LFY]
MATNPTLIVLGKTAIPGYGLRVQCELPMPDKDLSGEGSGTAIAERGFKPKRLRVSLFIRYTEPEQLEALVRLAEATDDSGERVIYPILNETAKAFRIREVRFTERLQANEQDGTQAWQVSFHLVEHHSIPEKVEDRKTAPATVTTSETGKVVTPEGEPERELTSVERFLKWTDDRIGPSDAEKEAS